MTPENALNTNANAPSSTTSTRRRSLWTRRAAVAACLLTALLLFLWYIGVFGGNVHAVVPGRVYRSAQLTGHNLADALDTNHIATVVNLRGGSNENDYYRSETQECAERRIDHVDIPFSARYLPPPDRLKKLFFTFDTARYPLLIHCSAGADRTGLASAIYVHLYRHEPLDQALREQLTWRHGHFPLGQTRAMDDYFALYRQTGQGLGLREWTLTRYPALYAIAPRKMPDDPQDVKIPAAQPAAPQSPDKHPALKGK